MKYLTVLFTVVRSLGNFPREMKGSLTVEMEDGDGCTAT